ncbi:unnamed protein product [Rangifer tarandus platyrhynchus]|uniref:Uncharacterized protein n=1 Tax=Rangifer tarandus platyrhynchus TaxID=3082113 RepID=A0ABN8ZWS5_RANTA|nr:unnamed protein product [Rangifer tarandus platyrhynchus]
MLRTPTALAPCGTAPQREGWRSRGAVVGCAGRGSSGPRRLNGVGAAIAATYADGTLEAACTAVCGQSAPACPGTGGQTTPAPPGSPLTPAGSRVPELREGRVALKGS